MNLPYSLLFPFRFFFFFLIKTKTALWNIDNNGAKMEIGQIRALIFNPLVFREDKNSQSVRDSEEAGLREIWKYKVEVWEFVRTINRQDGKETRENRNNAGNIREGKNSICDWIHSWKWKCLLPSHVWLFVIARTVAHQAPLPMEFSRQEYWSGLPFPPPGDLPDPGIKARFSAMQADSLRSEPPMIYE